MMYVSNKCTSAENAFNASKKIYEANGLTSEPNYGKLIGIWVYCIIQLAVMLKRKRRQKKHLNYANPSMEKTRLRMPLLLIILVDLYKDMGRYSESEKLLDLAIQLSAVHTGKQSAAYAITLNNKAMLFEEIGRFRQAEQLLSEAIKIVAEVIAKKSTNDQRLLINEALLYQEMRRFEEADAIYKKAISIKEKQFDHSHPDYAHLLNLQAELYLLMHKTTEV